MNGATPQIQLRSTWISEIRACRATWQQTARMASRRFPVSRITIVYSYTDIKSALISRANAEPNNSYLQLAIQYLPVADPTGGQKFTLPVAYAQLLGFSTATTTNTIEDYVALDSSAHASDAGIISSLLHEITEGGMGRIGGLGDFSYAGSGTAFWGVPDLFRYNANGLDVTSGRDGRNGLANYFSYNGGASTSKSVGLTFFNNLTPNGTRKPSSASDTGDNADFMGLDVFGSGEGDQGYALSPTDLQIMDVLGWMPNSTTAAPIVTNGDTQSVLANIVKSGPNSQGRCP